jgi:predicted nucleic acid-binding protein
MSSEPSGNTVVDTGVLLELATDSPLSRRVSEGVLGGKLWPITGKLNVMELGYIICRRAGVEEAARSAGYLRRASQFRILPPSEFLDAAARIKCARRLSLVGCITMAMAESLGAPVLFARRERELAHEIAKSPFKTRVLFLRD